MERIPHTLQIDQQKVITATAIAAVESFSPNKIVLCYEHGKIYVSGSGLKITAFSQTNGSFTAQGTVQSVQYNAAKGWWGKLLK